MKARHARLPFSGALEALFSDVDLVAMPAQRLSDFTLEDEAREFSTPEVWRGFYGSRRPMTCRAARRL